MDEENARLRRAARLDPSKLRELEARLRRAGELEAWLEERGVREFEIWVRPGFKTHLVHRWASARMQEIMARCGTSLVFGDYERQKTRDKSRVTCKRCRRSL